VGGWPTSLKKRTWYFAVEGEYEFDGRKKREKVRGRKRSKTGGKGKRGQPHRKRGYRSTGVTIARKKEKKSLGAVPVNRFDSEEEKGGRARVLIKKKAFWPDRATRAHVLVKGTERNGSAMVKNEGCGEDRR